MLDKVDIYKLLLEKYDSIEKKIIRVTKIKFIIPVIYIILSSGTKISFKLPFINLEDVNLILVLTPAIYSILLLQNQLLNFRHELIKEKLNEIESMSDHSIKNILNGIIYPNGWRNLLSSMAFITEVPKLFKKSLFTTISFGTIIFLPIVVTMFLIPICFLFYSIHTNYYYSGIFKYIANFSIVFAIWTSISLLVNTISKKSKNKQ